MSSKRDGILILGYGNPGCLDDGLGPFFAESVATLGIDGVTVEAKQQLTVEDAAAVVDHEVVLFVDAAIEGFEPFTLERARPQATIGLSTHSVTPPELLALARELFGSDAEGYLLGIRGYSFDGLGERLSQRAESNLKAALDFLVPALRRGPLRKCTSETSDRRYPVESRLTRSLYA